ncbi:hypothetical protein [Nocardioides pakistanensis]
MTSTSASPVAHDAVDGVPGEQFGALVSAPVTGAWAYCVDDNVRFGKGWWPFYRADGLTGRLRPTRVRLAPDTAYQSWHNEYVLLDPVERSRCRASLTLFVRKQGLGGFVLPDVRTDLDIRSGSFTFPRPVPDALIAQAQEKATKILDFLRAARTERRTADQPMTAYELHLRRLDADDR